MQTTMRAATHPAPTLAAFLWLGHGSSALAVLMVALDGATKVLRVPAILEASAQIGFAASTTVAIGVLLLACLAIYLVPQTAPLGAALLTGYLGGAVATHVRLDSPAFSLLFPVVLGAILWGGLSLRDARVRVLLRRP